MKPITQVILGDGVAGMSAASIIRAKRPDDQVVIVSNDPQPYYFRAALTNYLMGELSDEEVWALPPDHWDRMRLERVYGNVAGLDASNHELQFEDGRRLPYDRLLIATGARARRLETPDLDPSRGVPGADFPGVHVMRTLADTRRIIEHASQAKHAVVLGGGILGLEICHGLRCRNTPVSLVHKGEWLMERVVTRRAGELIQHRMRRDGVNVHLGGSIARINGSAAGVTSVQLQDGTTIPCSLLICSIGIVPNTEWLSNSPIELNRGYIPVDRRMRVAGVEDVWSAGDVVYFHDDTLPFSNPGGLWQPARKHGQVAGLGMSTEQAFAAPEYRPGVIYNATRGWDLDLSTLGDHVDAEGTTVTFDDRQGDVPIYKRILIRDRRVVGALLLGDRREGHALRHLMNLKGPQGDVSPIVDRLLDPEFDLPAWVASRVNQPDVERYKASLLLPAGPLPPSVAAASGRVTQSQIAFASPMNTMTAQAVEKRPITIRGPEKSHTFEAARLRIGRLAKSDIVVDDPSIGGDEIIITLEGAVWVANSNRSRNPKARFNQQPLLRPELLENGDLLSLGNWRGLVQLATPDAQPTEQSQQFEQAALIYRNGEFPLQASVTMIGASPDNDIEIATSGISLFHAQIHRVGDTGDFYIMDAGSENGTFLNGQRVYSPAKLSPGCVLRIGGEELHFQPVEKPIQAEIAPTKPKVRAEKSIFLSASEGPFDGQVFEVPIPGIVGRSSSVDVSIRDNLLSRRHVGFNESKPGQFAIVDLDSVNGTIFEGARLSPHTPTPIIDGAKILIGRQTYQFLLSPPNQSAYEKDDDFLLDDSCVDPELHASVGDWSKRFVIESDSLIVGRGEDNDIVLPDAAVSRIHLKIERLGKRIQITDLQSSHGTRLNGRTIAGNQSAFLNHGDQVELGNCLLAVRLPSDQQKANDSQANHESAPSPAVDNGDPRRGFRVDWSAVGDPLTKDLQKTVLDELDSCIGCHDCMRACPLPDSGSVSIAALNAFGSGLGTPSSTTQRFVEQCTQCQACVPVCPADIQRSRIVLWNKLKQTTSPDQKLNIQVKDTFFVSETTIGDISNQFAAHMVLGALNGPERIAMLGNGRFRQCLPGEFLVRQGQYPDTMWIIVDGRLELGMATEQESFQQMVVLNAGQTVSETAVLSDQPSAVSARSIDRSLVLGLPKYVLKDAGKRNSKFRNAIDGLYVSRSLEVFVRKIPALANASDELLTDLIQTFDAERYLPGMEIFNAEQTTDTFALVRRGFVKEIRLHDGRERIANYLKEGDAFGGDTGNRRGMLVRFEAATLAEVFTVTFEQLQQLEQRWPGLTQQLTPLAAMQRGPKAGQTETFQKASAEGLLQATRLMVIDTRSCVDCDNCVDACERRHGAARIDRGNAGLQVGAYQVPASCYHCDDPVCLLCAVDGIVREASGEIRIISDNCIGCAACATRCPYDNIQMVERGKTTMPLLKRVLPRSVFDFLGLGKDANALEDYERVAAKCDLCAGYHNGPACVRSCPTGAAMRIDPLEFFGS